MYYLSRDCQPSLSTLVRCKKGHYPIASASMPLSEYHFQCLDCISMHFHNQDCQSSLITLVRCKECHFPNATSKLDAYLNQYCQPPISERCQKCHFPNSGASTPDSKCHLPNFINGLALLELHNHVPSQPVLPTFIGKSSEMLGRPILRCFKVTSKAQYYQYHELKSI